MKTKTLIVVVAVAALLASCRGRESAVTGSYGTRLITGQAVMGEGLASSSPAGVQVVVVGTGMSASLGPDGRFTFVGVPEDAELQFSRADGVSARVRVDASSAPLVVELSSHGARVGRSRGTKRVEPQLQYEGVLRAVSPTEITVFDSHGNEVPIAIDPTTVIRRGGQPLTTADLNEGDHVHVQAYTKDSKITASLVILQGPEGENGDDPTGGTIMTANGTVKAKDGKNLTVTTVPKGDVTVQTDDRTIIRKQGQIITVAQINVGDQLNSMGTKVDDKTLLARQIEVRGNSKH